MARTNERVMDMVRRALQKDPDTRSGKLYEQAKKLDRSIGSLSLRQFHARYPLQVKRTQAAGDGRKRTARKGGTPAARRGSRRARGGARRGAGRTPQPAATRPATDTPAATQTERGSDREAVRRVLLDFATTVARADDKADMIGVLSGLDDWVDRVLTARPGA